MKETGFSELSQILDAFVQKLGYEKKLKESQALNEWHNIVGVRISKISKPVKISNGKLFVEVSNASWRSELMLREPQIKDKINNKIGTSVIKDIVFV